MGELVYSALQSLDGYVADEHGDFGWAAPDEQVHAFVNELTRPVGTHLLGRRMYEVLEVWDRPEEFLDITPAIRDFAELWQAADKVVYSRTLEPPAAARTRVEREFEPEAVRALKDRSDRTLSVGGPALAAEAFRAGLVDELQLFVAPVIVGGGTRSLPDAVRLDLELVEERAFDGGMAYLRYRTRSGAPRRQPGARRSSAR